MDTSAPSPQNELWYSENLMSSRNNVDKNKSNKISSYSAIWGCKLMKITVGRHRFSRIKHLICCSVHSNMVQILLNDYYQRSTLIF